MFGSSPHRAAAAYKRVGLSTSVDAADPHHLITLLFEGLLEALGLARAAMQRGDIAAKGENIVRAVRILEEGLKAGLNAEQGGELAVNLRGVYDYSIARLTLANLRNSADLVDEVIALIEPVADAWRRIGTAPAGRAAASTIGA